MLTTSNHLTSHEVDMFRLSVKEQDDLLDYCTGNSINIYMNTMKHPYLLLIRPVCMYCVGSFFSKIYSATEKVQKFAAKVCT